MGSHTSSYILKDFGTLFITGPIGTSHVEDQGRSNGRISSCEETDCLVLSFGVYNKIIIIMTRGNQRDKAREKAAKADKGKGKAAKDQEGNKGLNMEQRKQRDADIMRQKQEKKAAEAAAKAGGGK